MSQRQPVYRRPSWAQNQTSYKVYMRKDLAARRPRCSDFGLENFSYDEAHVSQWQMPELLADRVHGELRDAVNDWISAGAAVCTALDRIEELNDKSLYRGYPDYSRSPFHLSRRASTQSSGLMGAVTPPMSPPVASTTVPSHPLFAENIFDALPQPRVTGMDSPPFTPTDSQTCPAPDFSNMEKTTHSATIPDVQLLARHDSAASSVFDENAWEFFIKAYRAELIDVRQHSWVRFKGYGYLIDRIRVELRQDRNNHDMLEAFNKWWAEMKPKVQEYEEKVRQLEEPTIELVRIERTALGLPV